MHNIIKNVFSGVIIGSSMLIPGVSGGTTAIIIGIYDRLIKAVSDILKDFGKNIFFLIQVALGGVVGILLFSKAILFLTNEYHFLMMYFFIGAIFGSIPLMIKKADISMKNIYNVLFVLVGVLLALAINFLPRSELSVIPDSAGGYIMLFLCGIIIALALILPGISTSHILLILGMYETVLGAVSDMNLVYISILGGGVLAGVFLCTRLLEKAMNRFPSQTFMSITGFVMASVYDIFPGIPSGIEMIFCILLFMTAFVLTCIVSLKNQ